MHGPLQIPRSVVLIPRVYFIPTIVVETLLDGAEERQLTGHTATCTMSELMRRKGHTAMPRAARLFWESR
jgi:hypothetical protein